MNWSRIVMGGVAAGIVGWLADFVMHGIILGGTYKKYPEVFSQTAANPMYFLAISLAIWIMTAILFAKTRASWAAGWKGGSTFGFFLGLAVFFSNFIYPLVIDGFPYYLGWCWGGTGLICAVVAGAALGAVIQRT
jgi:hypothetical protein